MTYYSVSGGQGPQFFDGEFEPYPDLTALFLGSALPDGLRVKLRTGSTPGDMIFATPNVVSQRFLDALVACNATGYQPLPVRVENDGVAVGNYYALKLLGRGGPLDEARSEVTRFHGAVMSHNYTYMDEKAWDGSDVFAIPGLGIGMFVTERVHAALVNANLTNVQMVVNHDCYMGGPRLRAEWARMQREGH